MNAPAATTSNPRSPSRSAASSSASSKSRLPYSPTITAGVSWPIRCANSSRSSAGTRPAYTGKPNTSTSSAPHETSAGRCPGNVRSTISTEAPSGAASAPATSSATVLVVCVGLKYATRTIDGITVPLFSDNPTMILLFMPGWRSPNDEEPGGRGCRALQSGGAGESRPVNGMSYVVARSRSS